MNVADSQRVASALEHLGYEQTPQADRSRCDRDEHLRGAAERRR